MGEIEWNEVGSWLHWIGRNRKEELFPTFTDYTMDVQNGGISDVMFSPPAKNLNTGISSDKVGN